MSGFTLVVAIIGVVLGILLDSVITLVAVLHIKKTQTELLEKANDQFISEIEDISKQLIGEAIQSAVRNIYSLIQSQQNQVPK